MWAWSPLTPPPFSPSGSDTPPHPPESAFHRQVMDELDQAIANDMARRGYGMASQGRFAYLARTDISAPASPAPASPSPAAEAPTLSSLPSTARSSLHQSPHRGLSGLAVFPEKDHGRRPIVRTAGAPPVYVSELESALNPPPGPSNDTPQAVAAPQEPSAPGTQDSVAERRVPVEAPSEASDLRVEDLTGDPAPEDAPAAPAPAPPPATRRSPSLIPPPVPAFPLPATELREP
eukprot:EG_transcript_25782